MRPHGGGSGKMTCHPCSAPLRKVCGPSEREFHTLWSHLLMCRPGRSQPILLRLSSTYDRRQWRSPRWCLRKDMRSLRPRSLTACAVCRITPHVLDDVGPSRAGPTRRAIHSCGARAQRVPGLAKGMCHASAHPGFCVGRGCGVHREPLLQRLTSTILIVAF